MATVIERCLLATYILLFLSHLFNESLPTPIRQKLQLIACAYKQLCSSCSRSSSCRPEFQQVQERLSISKDLGRRMPAACLRCSGVPELFRLFRCVRPLRTLAAKTQQQPHLSGVTRQIRTGLQQEILHVRNLVCQTWSSATKTQRQ